MCRKEGEAKRQNTEQYKSMCISLCKGGINYRLGGYKLPLNFKRSLEGF